MRADKTLVSGKAATLRAHAARFSVETPVATHEAPIGDARRAFSYLVAALAALAATYARYMLSAIWSGTKLPFITFYPAVALAAWFGGPGPGLLATAISTVGALLPFAPLGSLRMEDPYDFVAVGLFTSVNLFISALTGALHRTRLGTEVMRDATRQSEDRLRAIVFSATDAIITIDADYRITLFNAAAEAIFGYSGDEMTGQTLDQLIPERFREIHRRHIEVFGATGVNLRAMGGERVLAGLRRSGEEFPMEARISQIEVAGQKLYTVILRDITGRKRAEAEREELLLVAERARGEAERALQVVEQMQSITEAALADLPFDGLLNELIHRVHHALGADTAVILLEENGLLQARAAVGLERALVDVRVSDGKGFAGRIAKERQPIVLNEVDYDQTVNCHFRESGIRSLAGVPLLSGDGRVLGVLQVGSIRPRQFGDDDVRLLQLAGERVAHGIERAARIDAERRVHAEIEAASRAKDEFLAMLGHELRNPLAAVQNAVVIAKLDESRRERALEIARRQVEQLGRLIDDLLDLARITQGRITLRKKRFHLAEIVQHAIEATSAMIEERRHHLSISFPHDDLPMEADPARVEQIVANLLTNAAKYTEKGGRIGVTLGREGDEAVIRVRDSGIGIAPDMLTRVFDLFTQVEPALDRADGGLGIGLTVTRRLVELHGGRIEAHSGGIGKGAEFVVRLPIRPATPEEARQTLRGEPAHQDRARVLLVEDSPDTAESLMMLLEVLGHQVRVTYDGGSALDVAQASVPDVMMVDIGLPGMDGYEVARRIRQHPDLKHVILVALTAYGRDEDRQRAFAAGFDYHLVKPVSPDAIQDLVARLGRLDPKPPSVH